MTKKQKCPICESEVTNLSKHLVLNHNIKDIEHLKTKVRHPIIVSKPKKQGENITRTLISSEKSSGKDIILTSLKIRNETVARTKMRHIRRMGKLIEEFSGEKAILNEGIDALISCISHSSTIVKKQAVEILVDILTVDRIDLEIKRKIRSSLEVS